MAAAEKKADAKAMAQGRPAHSGCARYPEDLPLLRYRLAAALVGDGALARRGLCDLTCPHCKKDKLTAFHLAWVCPAFDSCRPAALLQQIGDPAALPVCFRDFGIAPAMSSDTTGVFWVRDPPRLDQRQAVGRHWAIDGGP